MEELCSNLEGRWGEKMGEYGLRPPSGWCIFRVPPTACGVVCIYYATPASPELSHDHHRDMAAP